MLLMRRVKLSINKHAVYTCLNNYESPWKMPHYFLLCFKFRAPAALQVQTQSLTCVKLWKFTRRKNGRGNLTHPRQLYVTNCWQRFSWARAYPHSSSTTQMFGNIIELLMKSTICQVSNQRSNTRQFAYMLPLAFYRMTHYRCFSGTCVDRLVIV